METTFLNFRALVLLLLVVVGMIGSPMLAIAQDAESDSVTAQDNSSSFNDSVQFDDMEPIFYEAADEEPETVSEEGSGIMLYAGIAIALVIILIVLKKVGKKKS